MRKESLPIQRLMTHESLVSLATEMKYADVSALYGAVGEGHIQATTIVRRLVGALGGENSTEEDLAEATMPGEQRRGRSGDPGVVVKGVDDVWIRSEERRVGKEGGWWRS